MKKIGIIGGLAWPSTIDYYRLLCQRTNDHYKSKGHTTPCPTPPIIIESVNIAHTRSLRGKNEIPGSWEAYETYFRNAFETLKTAGADFGILASNTPHMRLRGIRQGLDFDIISILETTATAVKNHGGTGALILGTNVTMTNSTYAEVLAEYNINANRTLPDQTIEELGTIIDKDLYHGELKGARQKIVEISKCYIKNPETDYVCLACTELPLAFPEHCNSAVFTDEGITYVNTTVAHVDTVLQQCWD